MVKKGRNWGNRIVVSRKKERADRAEEREAKKARVETEAEKARVEAEKAERDMAV